MKIVFLIAALTLASSFATRGQDPASASTSTADDGGRYEIIQVPYDRTITFRLDRHNGIIHRLANCPKDDSFGSQKCWKEMNVVDLARNTAASRPRFQIVINGPLKMIMLLQMETGKTWQFGVDPEDKWHPFIECLDRTNPACLWRP